jgi:multidrug efflux pump subunit AcrA (membrane-fusion protein)
VESTLNAYPDWKIPGEVIAIIPTADRGKATVKVRIALNVRDPRIVPDMGVNVSFLEPQKPSSAQQAPPRGVRVPAAAIVERDGKDVAFALAEGGERAELREVEVGRALGDDRQVTAGLSAGDTVVLDPPAELEDGSRVRVAGTGVSKD